MEETPTAAPAGLLIAIGAGLLKPAHIETATRRRDLAGYLMTASSVAFLNLPHGALSGPALAIALSGGG